MRLLLLASVLVLGVAAFSTPARAEDRIWSALVVASQAEKPKAAPPELAKIADKIERFFGYNQLELIGSVTKDLDENCERWLVPSQHFWLSVKSKKAEDGDTYLLQIALFHDRRSIVETQAKLAPNSPLLIRGPVHARGQIVIVLQVLR